MASIIIRGEGSVPRTVRTAAEAFRDSISAPNTRRAYGITVMKVAEQIDGRGAVDRIGPGRLLSTVSDAEVGAALESLWGQAASSTWNARLAAVHTWLSWCRERGWDAPAVPAVPRRPALSDCRKRVRSRRAIDRLIADRNVHLREKTLWRMLYETCAHTEELLQVNIEDLDLRGRRCPIVSRGAEFVYWDVGTARLLPPLIRKPHPRAAVRHPSQIRTGQRPQP